MQGLLRAALAWIAPMLLASCAHLAPVTPPPPENVLPPIDSAQGEARLAMWAADIDTFEAWLRGRHAGLFAVTTEESFDASFASLRADLPALRDDQIVVRMKAIAASIGSGHTGVWPSRGELVPRRLPIECRWLDDGVLIVASDDANASVRGGRIARVGNHDIETVLRSLTKITGHENESYLRVTVPKALVEAETLSGLGLVDDPSAVPIVVRLADGTEVAATLIPFARGAGGTLHSAVDPAMIAPTRAARPGGAVHGFTYLDDESTLYVWYDTCSNSKDRSVAAFAASALAEIDRRSPRLVVVDLRRNGGGNSALLRPFIDGMLERPEHNRASALVVLIGSGTFSSAGLNANEFRERTHATLVGQPTGQRPNSWFECRHDWLPNSLMQVNYMLYPPTFAPDIPDSYVPDVVVPVTSADWLSGRDVTFERALEISRGR